MASSSSYQNSNFLLIFAQHMDKIFLSQTSSGLRVAHLVLLSTQPWFLWSVSGRSLQIPCLQFRPLEISEYIQRTKTGPQMALLYTVFRFLASFLFISPDYWGCTWWKLSAVQKFYSCTWQRYAWCPWQPCLARFDWPFFEVLVMHIFLPDSGHSGRFQCHSSGIYQPKFHSCHGILIFW